MVTLQFSYCELATLFFWYKASVFTGPSQSHYINSHVTVSVSYAADIWNSSSFSNYFCSFWDFFVWGISLLNHGADLLTVETFLQVSSGDAKTTSGFFCKNRVLISPQWINLSPINTACIACLCCFFLHNVLNALHMSKV